MQFREVTIFSLFIALFFHFFSLLYKNYFMKVVSTKFFGGFFKIWKSPILALFGWKSPLFGPKIPKFFRILPSSSSTHSINISVILVKYFFDRWNPDRHDDYNTITLTPKKKLEQQKSCTQNCIFFLEFFPIFVYFDWLTNAQSIAI